MEIAQRLENDLAPLLDDLGYALFRITFTGGKGATLQIMAEKKDESPLSLDDCTKISRAVSAKLDVEDYIKHNYLLEVSSPGIDRPIRDFKDFNRHIGKKAKIEIKEAINSQKKFVGFIKEITENNEVVLTIDDKDITFNYDDIVKAKLTVTDDVFKKEKED